MPVALPHLLGNRVAEAIEGLQLDRIAWLMVWTCIAKIAGFYMQRLHYEKPYMRGSTGPAFVSMIAHLMGWVLFLLPLYVWYRVGLPPALATFVITSLAMWLFVGVERQLFHFPPAAMTLINTPIGVLAFAMAILAALQL